MKTENDLNAHLSKSFKKHGSSLFAFKVADKYTSGMSDFLVWHAGESYALEVKFIKAFPKTDAGKILSHEFSPRQLTRMRQMSSAGVRCLGAVGVHGEGLYLVPLTRLPDSGNWSLSEWKSADFRKVCFKETDRLMAEMEAACE